MTFKYCSNLQPGLLPSTTNTNSISCLCLQLHSTAGAACCNEDLNHEISDITSHFQVKWFANFWSDPADLQTLKQRGVQHCLQLHRTQTRHYFHKWIKCRQILVSFTFVSALSAMLMTVLTSIKLGFQLLKFLSNAETISRIVDSSSG